MEHEEFIDQDEGMTSGNEGELEVPISKPTVTYIGVSRIIVGVSACKPS